MALLSWSNQYEIGNDQIDNEHEGLFRLINKFHSLWTEAQNRQEIARILNQLIVYTETHFRHEEEIMEDAGFPRLDEHKQIHEAMIDRIFQLQRSYEEKDLHLEMHTIKFLKSWLIEHILENDYLFRDFLAHKKNAEPPVEPSTDSSPV